MTRFICFCLIACFSALPCYSFSYEEGSTEPTMNLSDYIKDYVDVPDGALNWKIFGATPEQLIETQTEDGYDNSYSKPTFQPDLIALDDKEITIKGYMFPLGSEEKQKLFLFGPFPLSCPFQYHVTSNLIIEVHADGSPVEFSYEAITLTGTLELVPEDPDYGIFYRLKDTKKTKKTKNTK